ncbi:sensor histidine kinase with ATPase domain [Pseudoalteromonas luteoviolacea B = ATCC 29581]|nr:sensor histidine kinase with ATPase domain [Pseudoalteromonas luteoviolacea B = ATCC 29581]
MKPASLIFFLFLFISSAHAYQIPHVIQQHIDAEQYTLALEAIADTSTNDYEGKVSLETTQAFIFRLQSKYADALNILEPLYKREKFSLPLAYKIATEYGINARNLAKYALAKEAYERSLHIAIQMRNDDLIARSNNNLGVVAEQLGDFTTALYHYESAKSRMVNSTNWEIRGSLNFNIAAIYERLDDIQLAKQYFFKALEFDRKDNSTSNISYTTLRIANLLAAEEKYDEALTKLNNLIQPLESLGADELLARVYNAIASVYQKTGNIEQVEIAAQTGLTHALKTQSLIEQAASFEKVTQSALARKDLPAMLNSLKHLEIIASQLSAPKMAISLKTLQKQVAEFQANFELASALSNELINLKSAEYEHKLRIQLQLHKSSLELISEQQKVAELDRDRKLTISQLENAKLQQQRWLLAFGLTFVFVCTFVYLYVHKRRSAELKAQLYESNLKQKDQMLADISHELRTPLSVLKLHIEAMEHNLIDDKSIAYEKINDKINQLNHLISDVYQLSQAENNSLELYNEQYNVHQLMTSYSYDMQRMVSKHGLRFVSDIAVARDINLSIDKPKLDRIINNLTKNACLYTDAPGLVRLKVRLNPHYVFLQIDDSSPGVSKDQLNKLFERLYRVDTSRSRASGGSGLGLSICQSLIRVMRGKIDLKQGKYGGLCVKVLLPYELNTK